MSAPYVHPSEDAVLTAMSALVGTILGTAAILWSEMTVLSRCYRIDMIGEKWRAWPDSNGRPSA